MTEPTFKERKDIKIWRAGIETEPYGFSPLSFDLPLTDAIHFLNLRHCMQPIKEGDLPKYLFFSFSDLPKKKKENLKDIFWIRDGGLIITEKFKAVLD